jgi:hypothetical protein
LFIIVSHVLEKQRTIFVISAVTEEAECSLARVRTSMRCYALSGWRCSHQQGQDIAIEGPGFALVIETCCDQRFQ